MKKNLQADYEVFEQNRKAWAQEHSGEYVLLHARRPIGFYPDYESAYTAAVKQFGVKADFFIKQVFVEEPVFVIY